MTRDVDEVARSDVTGRNWLLIHGFAGSRAQWDRFAGLLPAGDRVVAADLPGHGHNPLPVSAPWRDVRDGLLSGLGPGSGGPTVLVGHSLGGVVAGMLAAEHPDRFDAVVMIGSAADLQIHPRLRRELLTREFTEGTVLGGLARSREHDDDHRRARQVLWQDAQRTRLGADDTVIWGGAARGGDGSGVRAVLAAVRAPTLLVTSAADRIVSPRRTRALATVIPGSTCRQLTCDGHYPHLQDPQLLLHAIREHVAGPARLTWAVL